MPRARYDPSRDRQELDRLAREFVKLLRDFTDHQPVVRGRLQRLRRRCGKSGCRCQRGKRHESVVFVDRTQGERKIRKVSAAEYLKLRKPIRRYQRVKASRTRLRRLLREVFACGDRLCQYRLRDGRRLLRL